MNSRYGELQYRTIDYLRFPLACAVVFIHSAASKSGYSEGFNSFLSIFLAEKVCRLAVPAFFLISGYLFFSHLEEWDMSVWKRKMQKRVKTLLLPYVLWNLIAFIALTAYSALRWRPEGGLIDAFSVAYHNYRGFGLFWNGDSGMPADFPLWFIRDLIIYVILTPVVFFFAKYLKGYGLGILALTYLLSFLREGAFFFVLGSFLKINRLDILDTFRNYSKPSILAAPVFLLSATVLMYLHVTSICYSLINHLWIITGVIVLFLGTSSLLEKGVVSENPFLAGSSFFIFATHGILILYEFSNFMVQHAIPWNNELTILLRMFTRPALAVCLCLVFYYLMKRLFPKTLGLLTGGRI